MTIIKQKIETIKESISRSILSGEDYYAYIIFEKPVCVLNRQNRPEIIPDIDIDIWDLNLKGSTFIINSTDVGVIFSTKDVTILETFNKLIDSFTEFLKSKGLNAIRDNNDIIVGKYKVCGITHANVNGQIICAMSFDFNVDLDLIKSICTKPMIKIPKSLADFGIKREEIIELILSLND